MAKPQVDDYVVTVDLGPDCEWLAEMRWPEGETQGGPAVLLIRPSDPDNYPAGGLSQTVLREVDFKHALERLRSRLSNSKWWDRARARSQERVTALLVDHAQGGITPEYLALLSRVYVGAVSQGQDKPLDYLAEVTGKSTASIKNHLWQATRKGLLERSPGRAGGRITDKARTVLGPILGDVVEVSHEMLVVEDNDAKAREIKDRPKTKRAPKALGRRIDT
ncbi:hypothetical protein EB73_03190 [Mycobacterium sp. SWH-M3]|nr:hypothetical protein EB73_03190 [Mycobacterium sp. SWH-M3]